jgi:hypothetical protein
MRALTRSVLLSLTSLGLCLAVTAGARAQAKATANERIGSGIDIYGGYGLYQPLNSMIAGFQYHQISNPNVTASVAKYFTNNLGAQVEGSYFTGNNNRPRPGWWDQDQRTGFPAAHLGVRRNRRCRCRLCAAVVA